MEVVTEIVTALGGWAEVGGIAFGGVCFFMVIFGGLIPARTFKVIEKDRDYLREAITKKDETIKQLTTTNELLIKEVGATVVKTMEALPEPEPGTETQLEEQEPEHEQQKEEQKTSLPKELLTLLRQRRS